MNSCHLAYKVWQEVRQWSVLPSEETLKGFVQKKGEQLHLERFVIDNAFVRLKDRIHQLHKAYQDLRDEGNKQNRQTEKDRLINLMGKLSTDRFS